jgi:hypothetical protein
MSYALPYKNKLLPVPNFLSLIFVGGNGVHIGAVAHGVIDISKVRCAWETVAGAVRPAQAVSQSYLCKQMCYALPYKNKLLPVLNFPNFNGSCRGARL